MAVHVNMSMASHHKVEDLATMTAERLASTRQLACSVHADKTSELYCPTHGAAICHLCATSKHRACPEVMELEEKMQEVRAVLAELAATLKVGESKLEGAISELDMYLVDMEKTTQAALADIEHKCDRLQSSVEAFRTRIDLKVTLPADLKFLTKKMLMIDEKALARIEHELSQLGQLSVTPAVQVGSGPSAPGMTGDMTASQAGSQVTVRLDAVERNTAPVTLLCGVTVGDQATLTLPSNLGNWEKTVVIGMSGVWKYGDKAT
nr:hypothetical protein BaRGS_002832 [Batillaria attramentaria]